jgi:hypothetical protein
MAGIDGIQNKFNPGDPIDKNLWELLPEELTDVPVALRRERQGGRPGFQEAQPRHRTPSVTALSRGGRHR